MSISKERAESLRIFLLSLLTISVICGIVIILMDIY